MSNFWREIQNGLSDCKYWGISEKILRKEYFSLLHLKLATRCRTVSQTTVNPQLEVDLYYKSIYTIMNWLK